MLSSHSQATWLALLAVIFCSSILQGVVTESASQETLNQLKLIEESVNSSADPCDDFYEYACGNWQKHHPYFSQTSMYVILHFDFENKVYDMLRKLPSWPDKMKENNQSFVDKALILYRACGSGRVTTEFFDYVKPGSSLEWPLIRDIEEKEKQSLDDFDWFALLGKLSSYGMTNVIIDSYVRRLENGSLHIEMRMPMDTEPKLDNIDDLLHYMGLKSDSDKFKKYHKELQDTHDTWYNLKSEYKNFNSNDDILTFGQVKDAIPKFATFLENMLPNKIQNDDIIQLTNLNYLESLLLKEWTSTELERLANYLMAQFFNFLKNNLRDCDKNFTKYMHMAIHFLYYEEYMKAHEKEYNVKLNNLLTGIQKYTVALLEENHLNFTDNMILAIEEKLKKLHVTLGNLPEKVDFAMVEEFYSDLPDLSQDNYVQNALHVLQHHFRKSFDCPKHMECIDEVGPATGNIPEDDLMIVPFASLTPPMYHWNFDPLFSISLLGTLIGHEFTHSMDTSSLTSEDVYESLHEDFNNHPELNGAKECMLEQKFTKDMRERVADFAGARAAYQLYAKEYNLQPSFSKTPWQQLFFLNMAQYFCQHSNTRAIKHDASDMRLRQIAMNSNDFAEAFKCPVGSNMNPEKKCRFY